VSEKEEEDCMGVNVTALTRVLKIIKTPAWLIWLNFALTLSVFPGVTVEFHSESGLGSWYPVILISTFNLADMLGRMWSSWNYCEEPPKPAAIRTLVLGRCCLIPLFILSVHPRILTNDVLGILLLFTHGVSSGYAATMCMVLAPTLVKNESEKEIASMLMVFLLMCGLATGAVTGSILEAIFDAAGAAIHTTANSTSLATCNN